MDSELLTKLTDRLGRAFTADRRVVFALLHGSVLAGSRFRDIDVAVLLDPDDGACAERIALDLEAALQSPELPAPLDLRPLNHAPAVFRHRVVSEGLPLYLRPADGELALAEFVERTILEYLDTEHLRSAIAAGLRVG